VQVVNLPHLEALHCLAQDIETARKYQIDMTPPKAYAEEHHTRHIRGEQAVRYIAAGQTDRQTGGLSSST
jgi:hypothetical protein